MYNAHLEITRCYAVGEVKSAIAIRLLAGGDRYYLSVIFDVHFDYVKIVFYHVLIEWIIKTGIGHLNMEKYIGDKDTMVCVSEDFSKRWHGVLKVTIGALDRCLVRVVCPSWFRDKINNTTMFFSRKGCYALDVQCIVDDSQRVL